MSAGVLQFTTGDPWVTAMQRRASRRSGARVVGAYASAPADCERSSADRVRPSERSCVSCGDAVKDEQLCVVSCGHSRT